MFASDKGVPYRSRQVTYSNGDTVSVDLSFLHNPMNKMRAPVVRELAFHFQGTVGGTTGGFDNKDGAAIFNKIVLRDRGGIFHDLPGKLVRQRMQIELGERAADADTIADAASGSTGTSQNMVLRVPFDTEMAARGADTALPLINLVDGGAIELTFGLPAAASVASSTVTVYALVHDEKTRELKSRLIVKNLAMSSQEDDYPIGGLARLLVATSNPTAAGYSAYTAATYGTINCPELEYSAQNTYFLRSEYRRLRWHQAVDDVILASTPGSIPLIIPSKGQRFDKLPDLRSVRLDIGAAVPTSAQLLMAYLGDRDPSLAAQWMGFADVAAFLDAVRTRGQVNLGGGNQVKITEFPTAYSRRAPIRLA